MQFIIPITFLIIYKFPFPLGWTVLSRKLQSGLSPTLAAPISFIPGRHPALPPGIAAAWGPSCILLHLPSSPLSSARGPPACSRGPQAPSHHQGPLASAQLHCTRKEVTGFSATSGEDVLCFLFLVFGSLCVFPFKSNNFPTFSGLGHHEVCFTLKMGCM